jgi:tetratricopeptide (TPR) repeat protein
MARGAGGIARMKPICGLLALSLALLIGCGKKAPEQQANHPESNPPNQPPAKPKATLTPGMEAAKKALGEGRYADAVRLYTAELATEEAKPAPSWVQLSYLNNELGLALHAAGQYDHALEYLQKALAIYLKQLDPDHDYVAMSYNNIGAVHDNKGEYDHALENHRKALAIVLKKLGADHPKVAISYNNIGAVHHKERRLRQGTGILP